MKRFSNGIFLLLCLGLVILFPACKRDKTPAPVEEGSLTLKWENVVGAEPLQLDNKWYLNQNLDTFNVSLFRYYISNFQLIKADGTVFSETESYHLVDQARTSSREFTIKSIPYGEYKSIRFLIGVDSTRNRSGIQSGALDVTNDMFWTWQSGYIMLKLEGQQLKSNGNLKDLTFHIGGFSGQYSAVRKVEIPFNTISINTTTAPIITFYADVLECFKTPNSIKFDDFSSAMAPGVNSTKIADNYSDMFTLKSIQN